jgi:aryl-alcohol dehydrogenase-like predicted oxidoreductase
MQTITKSLPKYRLLGESGLRVFPLSLGTMHFGGSAPFNKWGIGQSENIAEKIFLRYIEAGGNFIDTGNIVSFFKL